MDVKSHAPDSDRNLQQANKRKRCIAANGGEMLIEIEIELCCELDGHQMAVKVADLISMSDPERSMDHQEKQ